MWIYFAKTRRNDRSFAGSRRLNGAEKVTQLFASGWIEGKGKARGIGINAHVKIDTHDDRLFERTYIVRNLYRATQARPSFATYEFLEKSDTRPTLTSPTKLALLLYSRDFFQRSFYKLSATWDGIASHLKNLCPIIFYRHESSVKNSRRFLLWCSDHTRNVSIFYIVIYKARNIMYFEEKKGTRDIGYILYTYISRSVSHKKWHWRYTNHYAYE